MNPKLFAEIDSIVTAYKTDKIELPSGEWSMAETIKTINYYSDSKYLLGQTDNLGREKPFYNIVNQKVTTAVTKTDLDIKDVQLVADSGARADRVFLLSKESYEWMKESNFGKVLNDMGETAARYGGFLLKKCIKKEKGEKEEMELEVVNWDKMIVNPSNIKDGLKIEEFDMIPSELYEKDGVWNNVNELITAYSKVKKGKSYLMNSIRVRDVWGEFPETYFNENGDETKFGKYHFIIGGDKAGKQYLLFKEEFEESPYKFFKYGRQISGRSLGEGEVEKGFQAQIWSNDSVINEKNAMELAGKVILKTTSKKLGGNILTDVDNGHVIELEDGKDISSVNLIPSALPEFQAQINKWKDQYDRVASVYESNTGENLPSGTPFRLAAMLSQEANNPFDYKREQLGIFLTEIFKDWVIPYLVKKINKEHILTSDFTQDELRKIDEAFAVQQANEATIKAALSGKIVSQAEYDAYINLHMSEMNKTQKNRRFLEVPKNYFKDITCKITILTTGEQRNKAAALDSLNAIMVTVSQNPAVLQDPVLRQVFAKIVELSGAGISSFEIMTQLQPGGQNVPAVNGMQNRAPAAQNTQAAPLSVAPATNG